MRSMGVVINCNLSYIVRNRITPSRITMQPYNRHFCQIPAITLWIHQKSNVLAHLGLFLINWQIIMLGFANYVQITLLIIFQTKQANIA